MGQKNYKEEVEREFSSRRKKSYEAYQRAKQLIPAGVMSRSRLFSPYPIYIQGGKGSKITDLDGNELIDCAMGFGPQILGHAHPVITDAIREAAGRGSQFAIPHEEEYRLARLMVDTVPWLQKVSFCNTGSEAMYQAIRIVRAVTGKKKIAKFEGGYHGTPSEFLANIKYDKEKGGPVEKPNTVAASIGIPPGAQANLLILPFNHEAAFDIIEKNKDDLALVLVEVVQGMGGNLVAEKGFIQKLRKVTKDLGVVLMVDEIITGYRMGLGGGQEAYGIEADMAIYGKILGGGLAIGALGGKDWLMEGVTYTGDPATDAKTKVFYGGTFNGNMLTMVTGAAVLQYLIDHPEVYPQMKRLGKKLRDSVNQYCKREGMPVQMTGTDSMFCTHFMEQEIKSARDLIHENMEAALAFYPYLLLEGVYVPNIHLGFLSAVHTEEDIDRIIVAHCKALKKVREAGLM